jgi:hypothetical protein
MASSRSTAFLTSEACLTRCHLAVGSGKTTDNPRLFCYGHTVACVIANRAAQTTIASSGEKREPEVVETPLTR